MLGTAQAQDAKRVVVLDFDGAGAAPVRSHVVDALSDHSELAIVPVRDVENATNRLGLSLDAPADYVRVAEDLNISAFVGGSVARENGSFVATVWVRNGADGQLMHEEPWTRKTKAQLKAIKGNFWTVMGPHIGASAAPQKAEAPAPEAAEAAPVDENELEDDAPSTPSKRPSLIVSFGPRVLSRNLQYENDQLGNLRTYKNTAAFELALSAQWYPGATSHDDWIGDLGLDVDADYAIGLKSKEDGKTLSTTAYELGAGLIFRLPFEMFEPRFRLGYVRHVFDVDTASTVFLPSMTYSSLRAGLGTAIKIVDALSLDVGGAYLFVLDAGDLTGKNYFEEASVGAFEAGAGVLVTVAGPFAVRAGIDWRRYFFDLKPDAAKTQPGGQKLADGATDDYLRANLSFVYMMGGQNDQ